MPRSKTYIKENKENEEISVLGFVEANNQVTLIFILTFINTEAKKPPGYVAPPKEYDPNPPKYEYGYRIQEEKATHGKDEQRDGIYAQGRYYVEKGTESSQNVKYFADDWGYHPVVEYSNKGPHSKSSTNFALGVEAIKLKNNQKSIPQDPSDPGKAENLAKLDPSNQNQLLPQQYVIQSDPGTQQPSNNQPQILVQQPQQVIVENQSERPTVIQPQEVQNQIVLQQQDPAYNQPTLLIEQPQFIIQPTPTPITQQEVLVSNQPLIINQPNTNQNDPEQLIKIEDPQAVILQSTPQPEILLQNQPQDFPNIKLEASQLDPNEINNLPVLLNSKSQPDEVLIEQPSEAQRKPQPLFYYVETQKNNGLNALPSAAGNQLVDQSLQQAVDTQPVGVANQLIYPFQQYAPFAQHQQIVHPNQLFQPSPEKEGSTIKQNVFLQKEEELPQPQALIFSGNKQNVIFENLQNNPSGPSGTGQQTSINNDIVNIKGDNRQVLETAALTKIPNRIVEFSNGYQEFGAKLNPKTHTGLNTKNLIESTKNLVSGIDVLNINAAAAQSYSSNDEVESASLSSLLNQYVTPTIVNNNVNVDVNHIDVLSSTTALPPVTSVETSLLRGPIVVAESPEDSEHKPVIEKTDENNGYFSSTSRSSLISSTTTLSPEDIENFSEQILVTPRPVSSKFLAPITAGVQLQHIEEPIFEDTKTIETHDGYQKKKNVLVQVQKTIPYYLGMYEYPLGYAAQFRGHNLTGKEKAIENIELGKTLLYFPGENSLKSERLEHQALKTGLSQGISEVHSNYLTGQQLPNKASLVEIDQQALQGEQQLFIEKAQINQHALEQISGTESKVEQQFYIQNQQQQQQQQQAEVTKVVHQPYPVPYPVVQNVPYPVEKIVDRPIHVPVHVTKYVDRPYPVEVRVPYPQPYPVEKVIKEPYPVPVHVQVPVAVEKVVKEPYPVPVHVQVPVPHPVAVEKIVERKVPVPYYIEKPVERIVEKPVEKIVERNIPVPYYLDRVVEKQVPHYINRPYPVGVPVQNPTHLQQAYLLQIPGLFTQQKYSTLVHNTYKPQKLQLQYSIKSNQNRNVDQHQHLVQNQGVNPYSYASQINQYLPPKQELQINRGHIPQKLKKLNLLVFPRVNVPINLPPVTKNSYDLQQSQSYQSFRHSNAQLDNGYLPPVSQQKDSDHNDHLQTSASINSNNYSIKHPEQAVGLVPPNRQALDDSVKYRSARSHFDDKSVRLEYGFMPPLIPSLEIDEQGQPIEKDDNKN